MSAIGWKRPNNHIEWICGGSLISEKFVLSAAHCVVVDGRNPDTIRIGDQDLLVNEPGITPQQFGIENIFMHPEYRSNLKYHDIALFELDAPAM